MKTQYIEKKNCSATGKSAKNAAVPTCKSNSLSALSPLRKQLEAKTTAELRKELLALLSMTAQNLLRMAMVVSVLQSRGEQLTNFKSGFLGILHAIAQGKLLPEAVVKFSGEPYAIRRLMTMSIIEQKRATEGGELPKREPRIKTTKEERRQQAKEEEAEYCGPEWIKSKKADNEGSYFRQIAKKSCPKDVGEMAADLVIQSSNPKDALAELLRIVRAAGLL